MRWGSGLAVHWPTVDDDGTMDGGGRAKAKPPSKNRWSVMGLNWDLVCIMRNMK